MSLLKQLIKPGNLCFDIGAYTGEKTREMVECGALKVIAVEPQATILGLKSTDKIDVIEKAVSNHCGTISFYICDTAYTISTVTKHWKQGRFKGYSWGKTISVETITLDQLIADYGVPDYCKIDVEGHEQAVLLGLHTTIPCLSFEFTAEFIQHAYRCIDMLSKHHEFNLTTNEQNATSFDLKTWQDASSIKEYLQGIVYMDGETWGDIYAKEIKCLT